MSKATAKYRDFVLLALFTAIIFVLGFTPLGMIPLGLIKATTLYVPVIVGCLLLGPKYGAVLGFMFGLVSFGLLYTSQAMAQEGEMDLSDVTVRQTVQLDGYDCVGFASGIYGFAFQKAVTAFARHYLPQGKPVFFVYTYGGAKGTGAKEPAVIAREKNCPVLGAVSYTHLALSWF